MPIARNTDGFSGLPATSPLATLDIGNPFKWATFMEDFLAFDTTLLVGGNPYTHTNTNGTLAVTTPTGVLTQTLGGADNDASELQGTPQVWAPSSTKRLFFQARFNLTLASSGTIAANELFIGLAKVQTTTSFMNSGGSALAVDNCIGFVKYDATATMASVVRVSDVESSDAGLITLTSGTFVNVAFYYDGKQTRFWQGTAADGSDMSFASPISTLQADVTGAMVPTLFIKAGEAKANVLQTDYIMIAMER